MKVKIKDRRGIVKDMASGAILNTNVKEAEEYRAKKAAMSALRSADKTEERLISLEKDIGEIKELLLKVVNNGTR